MSFFARERKIKKAFFSNKPMLVFVYNEECLNSKIDHSSLPTSVISLLQDVQDVFPDEVPSGLPSTRGIEHHIDLILGVGLMNKPTYRNTPASWEECLPHLEFAYNRTIQSTSYSSFEVVYGFYPLTPLDILTLPTNEHKSRRNNLLKSCMPKFELTLRRGMNNEQYARQANKGHVMTFKPGDCVWPRGDGTFQVLERINDNAYKLDLSTRYGGEFDSRMNPFEEGGNDRNPTDKDKDNLRGIGGPMTRSKTKMMKQSLSNLSFGIKESLEQSESVAAPKYVTLLQDRSIYTLFYLGLSFAFPIPSQFTNYYCNGRVELSLEFPDGNYTSYMFVSIYDSSYGKKVSVGSLMNKAYAPLLLIDNIYLEEVQSI
ncbi:UPF0183 protein, partial [Mucuna pruriens]